MKRSFLVNWNSDVSIDSRVSREINEKKLFRSINGIYMRWVRRFIPHVIVNVILWSHWLYGNNNGMRMWKNDVKTTSFYRLYESKSLNLLLRSSKETILSSNSCSFFIKIFSKCSCHRYTTVIFAIRFINSNVHYQAAFYCHLTNDKQATCGLIRLADGRLSAHALGNIVSGAI